MPSSLSAHLARKLFGLHLLVGVPVLVIDARAQTVDFKPRVDFGMAQQNVVQTVMTDFDHDGHLDLAASMEGENSGKVEVLFGDGQSDFGTTTEFTAYAAWGLCAADFNADGWDDIAVTAKAWASHQVGIVLNNHTGGFASSSTVSTLASPPTGVVAGDFDSDGIIDLAAVSESGGWAVDWFHGYGNGTFSTFHAVPNTLQLAGSRIYTGNFNADAHLDLVITHTNGVMVLLNDDWGTGNFSASSGIGTAQGVSSLAVVDIDGDGNDDLLTGGTAGNLRVWQGSGSGSFGLLGEYPALGAPLQVTLGDVNQDGHLDALLVGLSGVQLFFGQGGGAFGSPQTIPSGVYPKSGQIGDWNGDGWPDLAVACKNYAGLDSYMSIYEQRPTGIAFCFGDGSGTACPCGNTGAMGRGCANSTGVGAGLAASGLASVAGDTVVLSGTGMPNSSALYFQGTTQQSGGSGAVFGDGLRCAAGTVMRLGTKLNSSGASQYPDVGDAAISVRGLAVPGNVRTYQCWYRNAAAFCNPETFNTTNGVRITWGA